MAKVLTIALGADHAGFELKENLAAHLRALGHAVEDCGTHGKDPVDYPRFAHAVATLVATGKCAFGVVVDGVGIGSAMAANKVPGVLAAACYSDAMARSAREHNDANVLTLGAGLTDTETATAIVGAFLTGSCTAQRHRARVEMIREIERDRLTAAGAAGARELSAEDVARIAARVRELMSGGGSAAEPAVLVPPEQMAQLIDHTLLRPEATATDIERLCDEARRYGFYSVCVNPSFVKQARSLLGHTRVKVCCVVGFPLGAQPPEIKALEARRALREGAAEIDMVIAIGALKGGQDELVRKDIRGVVEVCKESRAVCKVILETGLLSDGEKVRACELAVKAGADFVKTSTGFTSGGATVADVELMSRTVSARKLGVKASGGIRTYADALRMLHAGATRIGCSSSVAIVEEARAAFGAGKE